MRKRPFIIDCDPGVDDATAIVMLAACADIEIVGITPVGGNVSLESTSNNALGLCELLGLDCPVAAGAARGLIKELPRAQYAHGASGMGDYEFSPVQKKLYDKRAWELIYERAVEHGGELEIIAIGPLTNIAIAALKYPDLMSMVKRLYLMAGGAHVGNSTPFAEFNVWQDPHAAEIVFEAGFKEIIMADLDACYSGSMLDKDADRMLDLPADNRVAPLLKAIREFRSGGIKDERWMKPRMVATHKGKMVLCDSVAAAVAIDESLAVIEPYYIACECQSEITSGQTIVDWFGVRGKRPNVRLVRSIDRNRFVELYYALVDSYGAQKEAAHD